ncbi:MAG: hypothetical protein ACOH1Y_17455 [Propionicimonas sp.]
MTKNMARTWGKSFTSMRKDERGAEATEVIFILVIVVLGLVGAFVYLRTALDKKARGTGDCIDKIDTASNC